MKLEVFRALSRGGVSARNRRSSSLIVIILVAFLVVGIFVSLLPDIGQGQEKVRDAAIPGQCHQKAHLCDGD